jgi:DNA-binding transcriptional MerR regulator
MDRMYRVGEVAALTGVSVRTLHHYDRIGLLRPRAHSEGGHRLYSEAELLRLQQVLTLRYLGFPLSEIGALLDRPELDLVASIRVQRRALRGRIAELERIESALDELLERRLTTGRWAWELVVKASVAVQGGLAERGESVEKLRDEFIREQFAEIGRQVSPEEIRQVEQQWAALLGEVRANRDLDPASPQARALAERWDALVQASFRGNKELMDAVADKYREGRYADIEGAPTPEDFAFIDRVNRARGD